MEIKQLVMTFLLLLLYIYITNLKTLEALVPMVMHTKCGQNWARTLRGDV